jgi:uncharacterized pyridoxamine 5'-phosphate oxidase family protein
MIETVKSSGVPISELKKNSKLFFEIFDQDELFKVAKLKGIKLLLEDDQKIFFTTADGKELYFRFKIKDGAVK